MASNRSHWQRLVDHGFIKENVRHLYSYDERQKKFRFIGDPEKDGKPNAAHADEELTEEVNLGQTPTLLTTGFPKPLKRYRLVYESFNANMEETYFWFLSHLRQDQGFPEVVKISDIFSASENSAFFGQSAQRLSIQEDRASSFLRGIAEMVKSLFQIIRELRIIDERLDAYEDWERVDKDGNKHHSKSADSTLKGIFADFAENKGGQTQPGSIYHLAQTVGYASLPDLFFNTHVYDKDRVDKVIDGMNQFNANVRSVLKRKLYQFLVWKEKTHDELKARKRFQIRYLRQHWATIKMYMSWTKPYLKHIQRLHMNESQLDSADLVSAFETSMTEIELLFKKPASKGYHSCVLATYEFKTRPLMQYRQDYQQGPVHVGRVIVTLRSYGWNDQDIENYRRMKEAEDRDLLYLVDESVQAAMEELGTDLEKYLNDLGGDVFDDEVHGKFGAKDEKPSKAKFRAVSGEPAWGPFWEIFKGFAELVTAIIPIGGGPRPSSGGPKRDASAAKAAGGKASGNMYQAYKNYKKGHQLLAW